MFGRYSSESLTFFTLSTLCFSACRVAFDVEVNMEPVSILMKARRFVPLRKKNERTENQEAPLFFPPLLYICYDVTQRTSSPGTTVFQYRLEIVFLSLYNEEYTI